MYTKQKLFFVHFSLSLILLGLLFYHPKIEAKISDFDGSKPLTINICSFRNGVGLDQDIDILHRELTSLGHIVDILHYQHNKPVTKVDVNIFIEVVGEQLFPYADKNYFIPNPDWCNVPGWTLIKFDKILCKTYETLRIFRKYNPNSVYMSFTSQDRYDPNITKHYHQALHLAGGSIQKNTNEVGIAWQANPQFPTITLMTHRQKWDFPSMKNVYPIIGYVCREEANFHQNSNGLHICPSGMEGFGHYIMEGLSSKAVVVTLDAPPMNEFVKDRRCLVPYTSYRGHYLANFYHVDPHAIAKVVENLLLLPEKELEEIGAKNRDFYLKNHQIFKEKLAEIFPPFNN